MVRRTPTGCWFWILISYFMCVFFLSYVVKTATPEPKYYYFLIKSAPPHHNIKKSIVLWHNYYYYWPSMDWYFFLFTFVKDTIHLNKILKNTLIKSVSLQWSTISFLKFILWKSAVDFDGLIWRRIFIMLLHFVIWHFRTFSQIKLNY